MRRRAFDRSTALATGGHRLLHLAWLVLLAAALLLIGCSGGGGDSPTEPTALAIAEIEGLSFELVNQARAENGLSPLTYDGKLGRVARKHSKAMRDQGFFGHKDPAGQGLRKRLEASGVEFSSAGENLAQVKHGSNPAAFAHQRLMTSPEHRDIILTGKFVRVGVGVARAGETFWFTQVFVRP